MRQVIVRIAIVLFTIIAVFVVGVIVFVGDPNHYEELDSLAARFDAQPSAEHLRDLLNYPADGGFSYYQMALTGISFSNHPEVFREVSEDLQTERERHQIEQLGSLGARVFEYHPELKPTEFDDRLKAHSWLTQ